MDKIKIVIADDHRLVRDGIKSLLKNELDFDFVAEAENGLEVLELIPKFNPDVILMDISMPKLNGIEATSKITLEFPDVGVVMLSMHEEPEYVLQAIQNGACSYLLKNAEKDELVTAIKKASFGQKYFTPSISALMAEGIMVQKKNQKDEIEITEREQEVLTLVAEGLSTKQIAEKLFIGTRTVETHRLNLLKKFSAQNTAELIKIALERKIINI
jgi:DNA-binding NarL/FixJ family response regulator